MMDYLFGSQILSTSSTDLNADTNDVNQTDTYENKLRTAFNISDALVYDMYDESKIIENFKFMCLCYTGDEKCYDMVAWFENKLYNEKKNIVETCDLNLSWIIQFLSKDYNKKFAKIIFYRATQLKATDIINNIIQHKYINLNKYLTNPLSFIANCKNVTLLARYNAYGLGICDDSSPKETNVLDLLCYAIINSKDTLAALIYSSYNFSDKSKLVIMMLCFAHNKNLCNILDISNDFVVIK
jgi:hypothetical protein